MKRLTEISDWRSNYDFEDLQDKLSKIEVFNDTNTNIRKLWDDVIFPILPKNGLEKAIEIGSAPGQHLIELSRRIGVVPFGVEYTVEGVILNRALFEKNKIDANNVLHLDFFDPSIEKLYNSFDISFSFGFIEHFDNPTEVIERQLRLCKPGGYFIIVIPNLQGIYYWWNRIFNHKVIEIHNISLMRDNVFFEIFKNLDNSEVLFAGYVGNFDFGLLTHDGQFLAKVGITVIRRLASFLGFFDRVILAPIGLGNPVYQVVVGRRTGVQL